MSTVRELGELSLIDRLARLVRQAELRPPTAGGFRLLLGIGDDAAAWRTGPGVVVVTTDTMVEGVHFTQETMAWTDVGWKVMAANLSDIAAMGALPLSAVVTLGLPGSLPVASVDDLYRGMLESCRRYQFLLVGGDIVSSDRCFVTVTINGACPGQPLTRRAAQAGDAVAVTGPLGGSAGGLELLAANGAVDDAASRSLVRAHRRPEPRLAEGQQLVSAGIQCAMDVSDGLIADLTKLCRASGIGAKVYAGQVPVHRSLGRVMPAERALQTALNGGEEYELLFAGPFAVAAELAEALPEGAIIGEVTSGPPGAVVVRDGEGREVAVTNRGWEHLRR